MYRRLAPEILFFIFRKKWLYYISPIFIALSSVSFGFSIFYYTIYDQIIWLLFMIASILLLIVTVYSTVLLIVSKRIEHKVKILAENKQVNEISEMKFSIIIYDVIIDCLVEINTDDSINEIVTIMNFLKTQNCKNYAIRTLGQLDRYTDRIKRNLIHILKYSKYKKSRGYAAISLSELGIRDEIRTIRNAMKSEVNPNIQFLYSWALTCYEGINSEGMNKINQLKQDGKLSKSEITKLKILERGFDLAKLTRKPRIAKDYIMAFAHLHNPNEEIEVIRFQNLIEQLIIGLTTLIFGVIITYLLTKIL